MRKRRQKRLTFIKPVLYLIIICLATVIFYKLTQKALWASKYFVVTTVIIEPDKNLDNIYNFVKKEVIAKNIFQLDLDNLSKRIIKDFPNVLTAKLTRRLPDKIEVRITLRKPLAKMLLSKELYLLDREAILFRDTLSLENTENLPTVNGIDSKYTKKNLKNLIGILELINKNFTNENLGLTKINIDTRGEFIFFLEPGFCVKIGSEDFKDRITRLKLLLDEADLDLSRLDYIDVRFREPTLVYKSK